MNGNGLPTWVKVVAQVGFPIAVAIWLLIRADGLIARTAEGMVSHVYEAEVQTVLLRAICRNTAKSEIQASFCEFGRAKDR